MSKSFIHDLAFVNGFAPTATTTFVLQRLAPNINPEKCWWIPPATSSAVVTIRTKECFIAKRLKIWISKDFPVFDFVETVQLKAHVPNCKFINLFSTQDFTMHP